MKTDWPEVIVEDWNQFNSIINLNLGIDSWFPDWLFRGHSNSAWNLESSFSRLLARNNIYDPKIAFGIESTSIREFMSKSHLFGDFYTKGFGYNSGLQFWLIFMQHYGCPTRLLDWSHSPFVALYFAVSTDLDNDGAVFFFNERIMSNLQKENLVPLEDMLEERYSSTDFLAVIMPSIQNNRSNFQQGCFTINSNPIVDHQKSLFKILSNIGDERGTPFIKLIIPSKLKINFLKKLKSLNVRADILYPDLFGLGQYLRDLMEIRANKSAS
jgi:hypothetical protein